jgi:hypothetical protein
MSATTTLLWTAAGAAGAGLTFARYPWPASGHLARNVGAVLVAAIATGLITPLLKAAWPLAAAWAATALLLQWSHLLSMPGRHIWFRAGVAAALVVAGAQFLDV